MKTIKITAVCATLVVLLTSTILLACNAAPKPKAQQAKANSGPGFAVLELFTSEGCSSCPPADELLGKIQQEAGDKPVYVLSYHVDYWNRLGWKDVFSRPEFSKRQYQYNHLFTTGVYTPQLIINGTKEFVGSDEREIRNTINNALIENAPCGMLVNAQQLPGSLQINYQLTGDFHNNQLLVGLVQKYAISRVKAGENGGRTLSHAQIVTNLQAFDVTKAKGTEKVQLPAGFNIRDWEVVAFLQNPETGVISAANRAIFDQTASL